MNASQALRRSITETTLLSAPGVYDAVSAHIATNAGFEAMYLPSVAVAAAYGCQNRYALSEAQLAMATHVVASATDRPVIVETPCLSREQDAGRLVALLQSSGAAAVVVGDMLKASNAEHDSGSGRLASHDGFLSIVRSALSARDGVGVVVIARTDCAGLMGIEFAITRAKAAIAAGADMVMVTSVHSVDEMRMVTRKVPGPCAVRIGHGERKEVVSLRLAQDMGYRLAVMPSIVMAAAAFAIEQVLSVARSTGTTPMSPGSRSVAMRLQRMGAGEWDEVGVPYGANKKSEPVINAGKSACKSEGDMT